MLGDDARIKATRRIKLRVSEAYRAREDGGKRRARRWGKEGRENGRKFSRKSRSSTISHMEKFLLCLPGDEKARRDFDDAGKGTPGCRFLAFSIPPSLFSFPFLFFFFSPTSVIRERNEQKPTPNAAVEHIVLHEFLILSSQFCRMCFESFEKYLISMFHSNVNNSPRRWWNFRSETQDRSCHIVEEKFRTNGWKVKDENHTHGWKRERERERARSFPERGWKGGRGRRDSRKRAERRGPSKFISGHPGAEPSPGDKFHREHRSLLRTSSKPTPPPTYPPPFSARGVGDWLVRWLAAWLRRHAAPSAPDLPLRPA